MGRTYKYPPEFRREAVDLVRSSGRSRVEIARSLGVHDRTLETWVKAADAADGRSSDPSLSEPEAEELKRLRKEVVELRLDKEILKKAAAFFARETSR